MRDKGYDHPLYSLDLMPVSCDPEDDPRFFVAVPQGRLGVRPELRRRAKSLPIGECEQAVCDALARHRLSAPGFANHGLGLDWAENLVYWTRRIRVHQAYRYRLDVDIKENANARKVMLQLGRQLFLRLGLAARLAGLGTLITGGQLPRTELGVTDALGTAARLARDPAQAPLLAEHGFGPAQHAQLIAVIAQLAQERQRAGDLQRERRFASDAILVIRAAIVGDLARLCQVAQAASYVLHPAQARALHMGRLFPSLRGGAKERNLARSQPSHEGPAPAGEST